MMIQGFLRLIMKILGINTCGKNAFVYLKNEEKIDFIVMDKTVKVSEMLLENIEKLLESNNLSLKEVEYLACCVGPGSFTGIRIGIATCKAFLVANKPLKCVSYNTFEPYKNIVKNGNVFSICTKTSLYKCEIRNSNINKINVVDLNQNDINVGGYIVDEGDLSFEKFEKLNFDIKNYIDLIEEKINNKEFILENELLPNYACDSQAERNLKNANK